MKIQSRKRRAIEILSAIAGLVLALLLTMKITELFFSVKLPYNFVYFINFLCGILVINAAGTVFAEDSRIGGLLLASISIPLLGYFISAERVIAEALLVGVIAGALILLYVIGRNRFDVLAGTSKIFLTAFFIIIFAYLCLSIFLSPTEAFERKYEYAMGFALLVSLFIILRRNIKGIKAGNVFVFGLAKSGKTYLLLSFDHYMIERRIGSHGGGGEIISETPEELEIEGMKAKVAREEEIRSTLLNEVAEYTLKGKKWGIIPVELTFVDYGGGIIPRIIPKLNEDDYKKAIDKLSEKLGLTKIHVNKSIGSIDFLKQIKKEHKGVFENMMEDIILTYIYKKFENAGKVIVLIDGKQVKEFIENKREGELIESFGSFNKILQVFNDKKFAFVVTKADEFDDFIEKEIGTRLLDIVDNGDAIKLEEEIYEKLSDIDTFKAIIHQINRITFPTHFYLNSVDVRASSDVVNPNHIWRLGHERLERFIF